MRALGFIWVGIGMIAGSILHAAPDSQTILTPFASALTAKNAAAARQFIAPEFTELVAATRRICHQPEIVRTSVHLFGQRPKSATEFNGLLVITTLDSALRKESLAFQVSCRNSGTRWQLAAASERFILAENQVKVHAQPGQNNLSGEQTSLVQLPPHHAHALFVLLADGLVISEIASSQPLHMQFQVAGSLQNKNIWVIHWPETENWSSAWLTIHFQGNLPDHQGSAPLNSRRCYLLDEFAWHPCWQHDTWANDRVLQENQFPQTLSILLPYEWDVVSNGQLVQKTVDPLRNQAAFTFDLPGGQKNGGLNWVAAPNWFVTRIPFGKKSVTTYCQRSPGFRDKALKLNELTREIIAVFERNYSAFPLARCEVVEISSFPAHSRNCGAFIIIDEFDAPDDTVTSRLAHEIALSWFGTISRQAWLSEGFAAFSELLFWSEYGPADLTEISRQMALRYFCAVEPRRDLAISRISSNYSHRNKAILQGKGGYVLWMLRSFLGTELFQEIMQAYLHEFAGREASISDFIQICTARSPKKLGGFFKQWLDRPGAPEFQFTYQIEPVRGDYKITGKIVQISPYCYRAPVDIVIETRAGITIKTVWVAAREVEFTHLTRSEPIEVAFDPYYKLLRHTEELDRIAFIHQSLRKGRELAQEHKYNEALKLYQLALAQDSTRAELYYHQGKIFLEQQQVHSAFQAFNQAARYAHAQNWIEGWSYFRMGQIYDRLQMRDQAILHFKKALGCADTFRLHHSTQTRLRSLFFANGSEE